VLATLPIYVHIGQAAEIYLRQTVDLGGDPADKHSGRYYNVANQKDGNTIRVSGDAGVASIIELKALLLDGVSSGGELSLDLTGAGEVDIAVLQLLWTARRDAERRGDRLAMRWSESAARNAQEAGFESLLQSRD
jgi:hypothetical protein